MFLICKQRSLLSLWLPICGGVIIFILLSSSERFFVSALSLPGLNMKSNSRKCAKIICLKPPTSSGCYVVPSRDSHFRRPKADCCKLYRCFRKNGSGFTFHGLKGTGNKTDDIEIVSENKYSHDKSVSKDIQKLSKGKDTKLSVSSVATGDHDSNASAGDEKLMQEMIIKEFGFAETPSDNARSEESDDTSSPSNNVQNNDTIQITPQNNEGNMD